MSRRHTDLQQTYALRHRCRNKKRYCLRSRCDKTRKLTCQHSCQKLATAGGVVDPVNFFIYLVRSCTIWLVFFVRCACRRSQDLAMLGPCSCRLNVTNRKSLFPRVILQNLVSLGQTVGVRRGPKLRCEWLGLPLRMGAC